MFVDLYNTGFLSTGTKDLPGNNGLFDMILAVNWIKDYIEFFGGNPRKIIAFGHGTGASSALMLSLSKLSSGINISEILYLTSKLEYMCNLFRRYV